MEFGDLRKVNCLYNLSFCREREKRKNNRLMEEEEEREMGKMNGERGRKNGLMEEGCG